MRFRLASRGSLYSSLVRILSKIQTDSADPADIYFCYRLLLGRKAEREGWEHWSQQAAAGISAEQLTRAFLSSHEFHKRQWLRDPLRVRLDDFVIYVDKQDAVIATSIAQHKTYEPHVTKVIKNILRPDHVFVDIGCNVGWFALLAASVVRNGKVLGFEPNHDNVQLLYRSIAENGFDNIAVFPNAVTNRRCLLQLSGHAAYGFVHALESSDDDYVQGVALDELLRNEPRIDVIKMDIEGHEPIALEGMREIIGKHKPLIVSEFHPKCMRVLAHREPQEYLEALISLRYCLSVITFDGDVMEPASAKEIMDFWHALNQQYGTGDTMHLDLLARPV